MNDIFFLGDFTSDNGPGIANKNLKKGFDKNEKVAFSLATTKLGRIAEMLQGVFGAKRICLCSSSKLNILCISLCKCLRKKVYYLMHGFQYYEICCNGNHDVKKEKRVFDFEERLFKTVDGIICVSPKCADFLKRERPQYATKIYYIYNAVDLSEIDVMLEKNSNRYSVLSLGGGMPQKNNKKVCEAIDRIRNVYKVPVKYTVIGLPYSEKEEICKYDFVDYVEHMPHSDVVDIMKKSDCYIQNSSFETFGIAPLEALACGCSLILSKDMGVLSVFKDIDQFDQCWIIDDNNDIDEISKKLYHVLKTGNQEELYHRLDTEKIKSENVAKMICGIIRT